MFLSLFSVFGSAKQRGKDVFPTLSHLTQKWMCGAMEKELAPGMRWGRPASVTVAAHGHSLCFLSIPWFTMLSSWTTWSFRFLSCDLWNNREAERKKI